MKTALTFALLALSGCATIERHPYLSGFIATSIAISAAKSLDGRRDGTAHDVTTQPVNCANGSCK